MLRPSDKIRAYLRRGRDWGLDPSKVLEGSEVTWACVNCSDNLDLEVRDRLFDHIARRTPSDFAIRCGNATKISDFGVVGLAMETMSTLREAFVLWNRYSVLAGQPLITSISEQGDQWRMHFVPRRLMSSEAERFCLEASIAAMGVVIEQLTGDPANTLAIELPFERHSSVGHYAAFGAVSMRFGCEAATFIGRRSDLDRRLPDGDREISEVLHEECELYLSALSRARTTSQKLEDLIRSSNGRMPSLEEMAAKMKVSSRSLQRELSRERVTYQELVRRFRQKHAMVLLSARRPNIKEVAYILGFEDANSFRRAFRQWTGLSVREWKKAETYPAHHREQSNKRRTGPATSAPELQSPY